MSSWKTRSFQEEDLGLIKGTNISITYVITNGILSYTDERYVWEIPIV